MKRLLKWAGMGAAGLVSMLVLAFGFIYFQTQSRINRVYDVQPAPVSEAAFSVSFMDGAGMWDGGAVGEGAEGADSRSDILRWGEHLSVTRGCIDCHGEDLGGAVFADEMPVMRLSASNLTPGGVGAGYSDADWARAIRHGVGPDGKPLLFMPSYEFYYLGDSDLAALMAYLKSLPAVTRELEENKVGPLGRVLFMAGQLPLVPAEMIDHEGPRPTAPPGEPPWPMGSIWPWAAPDATAPNSAAAPSRGCRRDGPRLPTSRRIRRRGSGAGAGVTS